MENDQKKKLNWNVILAITGGFACVCICVLLFGAIPQASRPEPEQPTEPTEPVQYSIMDTFDDMIDDSLLQAHDAALCVKKVYWIEADAPIAPLPNADCYGEAGSAAELQWLLDEAAEILDGQETLFSTDTEIYPDSTITYYLDESIFVITWQQIKDNFVYTFSEVKITHPSQFRRYLANNEFDSDYMHPVSRMSTMANAVMASSADYYRGRNHGVIVYQGEVKRATYTDLVDTCFVDDHGDLILAPAGTFTGAEDAQKFVDEHHIDFSLAFGPILVDDGVRCEPQYYYLGEVNDKYPRAAICQMDELHYIAVVCNAKDAYWTAPTIHDFAKCIDELGCQKAYTLDGGQTGTIAMNGKVMNPRQTYERWISDILVFATAIPSNEPTAEEAAS